MVYNGLSNVQVAVHCRLLCVLCTIAGHIMLILKYVPVEIWVCDSKRSHCQLQNEYQYVVFVWSDCVVFDPPGGYDDYGRDLLFIM